jgi:hypothetical protein
MTRSESSSQNWKEISLFTTPFLEVATISAVPHLLR